MKYEMQIHIIMERVAPSYVIGGDIRKQSTIDSEGFKGGTWGAPIMPRDAVSRTANVERTGRH